MSGQPEDAISIRYRPPQGPPRRVTYEPRADGGWTRWTEVWSGCGTWRVEGAEPVEDLAIKIDGETRAVRFNRGP